MSMPRIQKIALIGDIGVGKTQLVKTLNGGTFSSHYQITTGFNFGTYASTSTPEQVILSIWDIAGQEKSISMLHVCARDTKAIVVCYDVGRPNTFKMVTAWVNTIKGFIPDGQPIPIMLLSLKNDLIETNEERSKNQHQLAAKAKEIGAFKFFEITAKNNPTTVTNAFEVLASELLSLEVQADNTAAESILRIQTAAHNAQQSRFKKPSIWLTNTALPEIQTYADKKPHSHTAMAKELNEKYPAWDKPELESHKDDKKNLIIEARAFLQSKNGFFKKTARDLSTMTLEQIEAIPEQKPHSCTAILVKGLRKSN